MAISTKRFTLLMAMMMVATFSITAAAMPESDDRSDAYEVGYSKHSPRFGGPTSPQGQLEEADQIKEPAFRFPAIDKVFQPWVNGKKELNDRHGIQFSGHYSILFAEIDAKQSRGTKPDEDSASSGVLRANLRWTPVGRGTKNTGSLLLTIDHRHSFTDTAPADLAPGAGYMGVANTFYNDMGGAVINLNWQQGFNDGDTGLVVGRYDPNDYQTIQGSTNPWTLFSNIAVALDASVAFPDSSWGVGAGHWFSDQLYALGGINDANGLGSDNLEWFEGGGELYKWAHVGWSPSKDQRYFKNVHLSTWHADERDARIDDEFLGTESSHGFTLSANWMFADMWMPFMRYGKSQGSAPIYKEAATIGLLKKLHYRSDVLGIAVNWGNPPTASLREQTTTEAFWQFQFSQNLEITPSIQHLNNPSLNSDVSEIWQASVRANLTF